MQVHRVRVPKSQHVDNRMQPSMLKLDRGQMSDQRLFARAGAPTPVTGSIHSQLLSPDSILGDVLLVRHAPCCTKTQGRHCSLLRADRVPRAKSRRGSRRTQMSQTESKKHEEPELWSATVRVRRRGCGWGLFPSQLHLCLVRPARVVATPAAWSRHLRRLRFPR